MSRIFPQFRKFWSDISDLGLNYVPIEVSWFAGSIFIRPQVNFIFQSRLDGKLSFFISHSLLGLLLQCSFLHRIRSLHLSTLSKNLLASEQKSLLVVLFCSEDGARLQSCRPEIFRAVTSLLVGCKRVSQHGLGFMLNSSPISEKPITTYVGGNYNFYYACQKKYIKGVSKVDFLA